MAIQTPLSTTSQTAPTPPGKPILGNVLEFRADPIGVMKRDFDRYGDVVRYKLGPRIVHVASHPELAQEIFVDRRADFVKMDVNKGLGMILGNGLVTSPEDSSWLSQRRMMQPMFHKQRLAAMGDKMVTAGERLLAGWEQSGRVGQMTDISAEMMGVTLDIITQTMFSMDMLSEASKVGPAIGTTTHFVTEQVQNPFSLPLWLPTNRNRTYIRAKETLYSVVDSIIRARRAEGTKYGDLLDMLLEARDEDTGEGMSEKQLQEEVVTIFAAGHETTANTLAWTWFVLAQYPEIRTRLETELDTVLQGRTPTISDLPQLPYSLQVLNEVLRLYPVVPFTVRRVARRTTLGGYTLPADSLLFISMANIHRHPHFWSDPATFNPDRWAPDVMKRQHRLAFIPFGAGPRMCIGNHMALMEGQLLIAMIAQKYRLHLENPAHIQREVAITMRPKGGLPMRIEARN
jgi:cytochrome P450